LSECIDRRTRCLSSLGICGPWAARHWNSMYGTESRDCGRMSERQGKIKRRLYQFCPRRIILVLDQQRRENADRRVRWGDGRVPAGGRHLDVHVQITLLCNGGHRNYRAEHFRKSTCEALFIFIICTCSTTYRLRR
jgi:hypothetical protein